MNTKTVIVFVLLLIGVGCGSLKPGRGSGRPGPTPTPPWITNGPGSVTAGIDVPDGQHATIHGPEEAKILIVGTGSTVEVDALTRVWGDVLVGDGATLLAPSLRECNRMVIGVGSTVKVPSLVRVEHLGVGEDADAAEDAPATTVDAPSLELVVGLIRIGTGAVVMAPVLGSCSGVRIEDKIRTCSRGSVTRGIK